MKNDFNILKNVHKNQTKLVMLPISYHLLLSMMKHFYASNFMLIMHATVRIWKFVAKNILCAIYNHSIQRSVHKNGILWLRGIKD